MQPHCSNLGKETHYPDGPPRASPVSLGKDGVKEGFPALTTARPDQRKGPEMEAGGVGAVQTLIKEVAIGVGGGWGHLLVLRHLLGDLIQ